ncbi:DUF5052 family protein [Firmicutes bacterium AF36-3BH]|nr:DUF5052 family protein [Firmicutes bacterium AF36-3BH]
MKKKILITVLTILFAIISCSGCALWDNEVNELNGSITGNTYNAGFYTNQGKNFMNVSGQKIDLQSNVIKEKTYNSDNGWGYNQTLSSVVTVIIDGKTIESCGSTMIFAENGLNPEVDFNSPEVIKSTSDGSFGDNVFIASIVNKYKNYFGKSRVVVIQSQLGDPICAYSGNEVYWEVCQDLPKTTKLMIDGKALYIHRANFQIIDKNLL